MSGRRGNRDPFFDFGDPFTGFGGLGGHQSLMSGFFGGQDPFDDPFFTRPPFGGMLESTFFGPTRSPFMNMPPSAFSTRSPLMNPNPLGFSTGSPFMNPPRQFGFATESPIMNAHPPAFLERQSSQANRSRGPIIEELNSDDEKEEEEGEEKEKKDNPRKHSRSEKGPYVEDPDDEIEERKRKQMQYWNPHNNVNNAQPHAQAQNFTFQSSSVTYGGSNGAYRTSSRTLRTGSDGLTIDESKEADSTTGRAAHRLSRGIHDKGHTVARNLQSDGRVDTTQILHNLNEGDLSGFEEAWKGNARKYLPGWNEEGFNVQSGTGNSAQTGQQISEGGWALPSTEGQHLSGSVKPDEGDMAGYNPPRHYGRMRVSSGESTRSSRGRSKAGPHY